MKKITKIFLCLVVISLVASLAIAFTACKKDTSLSGVSFSDGVLSWDKDSIVGSAVDSYKAFVNGVEKKIDLSENGKKLSVNLSNEMEGDKDLEVNVKAEGDNVKIDETIVFRKLPALTVKISNGMFDWTESAAQYANYGTMIYDIILDGKRISSVLDTKYKASTGETHTITVRPRVSGDNAYYFCSWSEECQATVLSTPIVTDVKWDIKREDDGSVISAKALIEWTSPTGSVNVTYVGTINDIDFTTDKASLDTTTIEGLDVADGFAITLKAKCDLPNIEDSTMSEVGRYISLAKPQNLAVTDGVLTFSEVKNAASYKIEGKAGAVSFNGTTTQTFYALEDAAESFKIKVTACPAEGYHFEDNPSEEISFNILGKPGIRYNSQAFFIEGTTENVKEYDIRIEKDVVDGEEIKKELVFSTKQDVMNRIFSGYDFKEAGRYWVSVKAVAKNGIPYMDSQYSDAYEVVRLDTIPGLSIEEIPSGDEKTPGYLKIVVEKVLENAEDVTRYQLFMDNSEISTSSKLTFKIPVPATYDENTYKFSVRTVSDDDGRDTKVVFSSYYSVDFYATKMSAPRSIALTEDGEVTWNMPSSNYTYLQKAGDNTQYNDLLADFQVVIANTTYTVDRNAKKYPFPTNLDSGEYYVNVYARSKFSKKNSAKNESVDLVFSVNADGVTSAKAINSENQPEDLVVDSSGKAIIVLSSDYSNTETMRRMAAPSEADFVIEDNTLSWPAVEGACGYDIYFATTVDGEAKYGLVATVKIGTNFVFDSINYDANADTAKINSLLEGENGCVINIVTRGNMGGKNVEGGVLRNGEIYSYNSRYSGDHIIFKLATPKGISVNDSYLNWDAVPYATGYNIYAGRGNALLGNTQATRTPSFDISGFKGNLYNITIEAIGDDKQYFASDRSEPFAYRKLYSMEVERVGDVYAWDPVPYALTYEIKIDGGAPYTVQAGDESAMLEDGRYYVKPTFKSVNPNGIKVEYRACASNGTLVDWTKYGYKAFNYPVIASEWAEFMQPVIQAATPVFKNDGENFKISSTYKRFYVEANLNSDKYKEGYTYKYQIGGTNFYSDTIEFTYKDDENVNNEIQTGEYTVRVAYGANFFDEDGNYVVDSEFNNVTGKFTFLRGTTKITVNPAGTISISWDDVKKAGAYRIVYTIYEGHLDEDVMDYVADKEVFTSGIITVTEGFSYNIGKLTDEKNLGASYDNGVNYFISVSVVTVGNGSDSVSAYDIVSCEPSLIS